MKKIINSILIFTLATLVLQGCKDDVEYNDNGTAPVSKLITPDDNLELELINNENAQLYFEWEPAATNVTFNYNVVFYASAGGPEIYRVNSDNDGTRPYATISHDILTQVAKLAGIEPDEVGDIYWNVITMRGGNESAPTAAARRITVERYTAFDDMPFSLYIYGEASEAGTDYENSPQFTAIDKGVFQIYTRLEGGKEYVLTNRATGAAEKRTFTIDSNVLYEDDTPIVAPADGIYRITVDFNTARTKYETVDRVAYTYPETPSYAIITVNLDYAGYGEWVTPVIDRSWSDNRYHFRAWVDGVLEIWGHSVDNTQEVMGDLYGPYFNVYTHAPSSDNWHYSYKLSDNLKDVEHTYHLLMNSDRDVYTHYIDAGDIEAIPVPAFANPADGHYVDLLTMGGSGLNFAWTAVTNPNGPAPNYQVVFFEDEELTQEVASFNSASGGRDANVTLSSSDLQLAGGNLTMDENGMVSLYWTVRTTVFSNSVLADAGARRLDIKLMSLPRTLALGGSDSEYGNNPGQLRLTGTVAEGKYEIYTRLSGSDYYFVDNENRTFYIDGGMNIVDAGSSSVARNGIYRINLDFVNGTATMAQISNIRFEVPANYQDFNMIYTGKGIWEAQNEVIDWTAIDWGHGDDRFYFWAMTDGAEVKWSSNQEPFNNDTDYHTNAAEGTDRNYEVHIGMNPDRYAYAWKIWYGSGYRTSTGKRITVKLNMGPDTDFYYVYLQYPDAV